jgi:hypothetical protein
LVFLAGLETFVDIARFGERKLDLLRRFRPFVRGTLAHDHLGDIFAMLDAAAFQRWFVAWVAAVRERPRRPRPSRLMASGRPMAQGLFRPEHWSGLADGSGPQ